MAFPSIPVIGGFKVRDTALLLMHYILAGWAISNGWINVAMSTTYACVNQAGNFRDTSAESLRCVQVLLLSPGVGMNLIRRQIVTEVLTIRSSCRRGMVRLLQRLTHTM